MWILQHGYFRNGCVQPHLASTFLNSSTTDYYRSTTGKPWTKQIVFLEPTFSSRRINESNSDMRNEKWEVRNGGIMFIHSIEFAIHFIYIYIWIIFMIRYRYSIRPSYLRSIVTGITWNWKRKQSFPLILKFICHLSVDRYNKCCWYAERQVVWLQHFLTTVAQCMGYISTNPYIHLLQSKYLYNEIFCGFIYRLRWWNLFPIAWFRLVNKFYCTSYRW